MRFVQPVTKTVYGLFGLFFVLVGGSVLLVNTGLLPASAHEMIMEAAQGDNQLLHVIQEWGNAHLLLGLLTFWFIWHYEQSLVYHWAMTVFFAVDALIHWFNVAGPPESIVGPVINTIPLVMFLILGFLRLWEISQRKHEYRNWAPG